MKSTTSKLSSVISTTLLLLLESPSLLFAFSNNVISNPLTTTSTTTTFYVVSTKSSSSSSSSSRLIGKHLQQKYENKSELSFLTHSKRRINTILQATEAKTTTTTTTRTMDEMTTSTTTPTEDEYKAALKSIQLSSDEHNMRHIFGHDNPNHKLSMLQKLTAQRIIDYQIFTSSSNAQNAPTVEQLYEKMKQTEDKYGPRLNLRNVIQNQSPSMALAAEFKRASPSKGDIAPELNAGEQAMKYANAGACVISVLTEPKWFKGSLNDLTEARIQTQQSNIAKDDKEETLIQQNRPAILRKEFITSTYQILEAAAAGADTVLLIVAVLPADLLKELIDFCRSIDIEPLVEVHANVELEVAIEAGAKVIGVNNRNLHTFQMDLSTTDRTAEELVNRGLQFNHNNIISSSDDDDDTSKATKPDYVLCSLSGMSNAEDVERYRNIGVGMVLIGESLMRSTDPQAAIAGLCLNPKDYETMSDSSLLAAAGAYTGGTKIVKVCGITNPEDALTACQSGASLIGVIFAEKSKRKVTLEQAKSIVHAVREFGERDTNISFPKQKQKERDAINPERTLIKTTRTLENICGIGRTKPLVVGVFQNTPLNEVQTIAQEVGLDLVQLHGDEGMEACSKCGVPAIRVVHIEATRELDDNSDGDDSGGATKRAEKILSSLTCDPMAILLDTAVKGTKGGTGVTFDWDVVNEIQNRGLPVIIAGGLNAENVDNVVKSVKPWGVDVSSGVEESPGKKDTSKVQAFVLGAKKASREASKGF